MLGGLEAVVDGGGLEAVVDGGGFHPGGGTLSKSCETWAERF